MTKRKWLGQMNNLIEKPPRMLDAISMLLLFDHMQNIHIYMYNTIKELIIYACALLQLW